MQIMEVLKIFTEERVRNKSLVDAIVETRIRLSTEVALRMIRPLISQEHWEIFLELVRGEAFWLRVFQYREGSTLAVDINKLSSAYKVIERAYESLLDEYANTSEYFQSAWPRDVLLEMACTIAVARETAIDELMSADTTEFYKNRAKHFVDIIHWAQVGFAGEIVMSEYSQEVNNALAVVRSLLG